MEDEHEDLPSREALATHEAGHAVVFLLVGCPFHSLTIEEVRESYGIRDGAIVPDVDGAQQFVLGNPPLAAAMFLVNACIGDVAMARHEGKPTASITIRDAEHESGDDASHLYTAAKALHLPVEEAGRIAVGIAFELFGRRTIWRAVERIRDLLLDHTTVSYREVMEAFDASVNRKDRRWAKDYIAQWGNTVYGDAQRWEQMHARRAGYLPNLIS